MIGRPRIRDDDREREFSEFAAVETPRLLRTARLLCGDPHLAEDLVATTLARLFVAWLRVRAADDPSPYAHAALIKTYLSYQRRRSSHELPGVADPAVGSVADPAIAVAASLDLAAALGQLDPLDRAVLVLRFWLGLPAAETAERLGMSPAAVRQRSSRAARRARKLLSEQEEAAP